MKVSILTDLYVQNQVLQVWTFYPYPRFDLAGGFCTESEPGVHFWSVAICWTDMNRFKDPSLLFRKLSWSGTCINQWPPGKTMSCPKKLDRYIFKAPKFEIGHILAVRNQDLSLCAPRYPNKGSNPCIKRLVFWSLTYLILCRKFPGGWDTTIFGNT